MQGLAAAGLPAQLGCAQAGVVGVRVFAGTPLIIVPCGGAGNCLDASTWRCDLVTGGVRVPVPTAGTYDVQIDGFDAAGLSLPVPAAKYSSGPQAVAVAGCGDTLAGLFPLGLSGVLALDYSFTDTAFCAAGSQIQWDLYRGAALVEQGAIACGNAPGQNPFLVLGGADLPAGVYTLTRVAEVTPGGTSVHALCSYPSIVHAGDETVGGVAPFLDLPPATLACQ